MRRLPKSVIAWLRLLLIKTTTADDNVNYLFSQMSPVWDGLYYNGGGDCFYLPALAEEIDSDEAGELEIRLLYLTGIMFLIVGEGFK